MSDPISFPWLDYPVLWNIPAVHSLRDRIVVIALCDAMCER